MRPINYQLTNILINNIVELEVEKALIASMQIDEKIKQQYEEKQIVANIFHMAHFLGLKLTLGDAEKFAKGKFSFQEDVKFQLLTNFRNVLEYIRANRTHNPPDINLNTLLHLNKLMINNWKEAWESQVRKDGNIDQSFDTWLRFQDETLSTEEVSNEIKYTFDWYQNNEARINSLVRSLVTTYRLIRIMPLTALNKFTILVLFELILQNNNYTPSTFASLTRIIDKNEGKYLEIWNRAVASPTGNITYWIEEFIKDFSLELKTIRQEIQHTIQQEEEKNAHQPFLNLNKRQLKILRYLQTIPTVKREDYVQMFSVSTMTAFRDLDELVRKKLLKIDGKGRATKYLLSNR